MTERFEAPPSPGRRRPETRRRRRPETRRRRRWPRTVLVIMLGLVLGYLAAGLVSDLVARPPLPPAPQSPPPAALQSSPASESPPSSSSTTSSSPRP